MSWNGGTAGEGPIVVGVAHSDYTDAEIEEVLENVGSWDEGDMIDQEKARRLVRRIGQINSPATAEDGLLNDGKPLKIKLNWLLTTGQTLSFFAFNKGGSSLTTGSYLVVEGHANLFPQ